MLNESGTLVARYIYNAWGELTYSSGSMAEINPLRYRGYYYDTETGFYYLQSRYYDPVTHRFINADVYTSTDTNDPLGYNMFAYCNNNPVTNCDPTGKIAITTAIFIGALVIGVGVGVYTGYKARKAGCDWADTLFYSIGSGLSAFVSAYSFGMTAYGAYYNICTINGLTPVTEIGGKTGVAEQIQSCADTANATVPGCGPVTGTNKHSVFAAEVNNLRNPNLRTEVSYLNGQEVSYGTKGSVRFDVLQFDSSGTPIAAWDLKTGSSVLTQARILQMQERSGLNIRISMVK